MTLATTAAPALLDVMIAASGRGIGIVARERGITLDAAAIDAVLPHLRAAVVDQYLDVQAQGEGLLLMGDATQRAYINAACMTAAINALTAAGLLSA